MYTLTATEEILKSLLLYKTDDLLEKACVQFIISRILDVDVSGNIALPTSVAKFLDRILDPQWVERPFDPDTGGNPDIATKIGPVLEAGLSIK